MELFSHSFIQAVRQILSGSGTVVLGTIPVAKGKPLELVEEIRSKKDVKVFNVSRSNSHHTEFGLVLTTRIVVTTCIVVQCVLCETSAVSPYSHMALY